MKFELVYVNKKTGRDIVSGVVIKEHLAALQ